MGMRRPRRGCHGGLRRRVRFPHGVCAAVEGPQGGPLAVTAEFGGTHAVRPKLMAGFSRTRPRLPELMVRYKISLGVGSAILYLHTECEQCVLHGDIKPANILLGHSCNAKLGDFGLARLVDDGADSYTTQVVAGTPGYMDPEFVNSQRPCAESDIFSFGVVLLEIACGRRPTTRTNGAPVLLHWARDMYNKNSVLGVADRRLDSEFDEQQMRRVLVAGLWCTHHEQSQRPSISQAMGLLRREDAELPVLDPLMHSPVAVRSLEEIAYDDLSAEDSVLENSSTDTAYHTSTDSSRLLE